MNRRSRIPTRLLGSLFVLTLITLACAPVAAAGSSTDTPPGSAEQAVRRAWETARAVGAYQFASDVAETTYPAPDVSNVGRTRNELHLEGSVDLPAAKLDMRLWTNGGSIANPENAAEMRIEGEQAWLRQTGGSWQKVEDFTGGFAPGGDFMSYLVGARSVKLAEVSVGGGRALYVRLRRPAYAAYMRDQLTQILREKGELPLNLSLDSSRVYQGMTGGGEVVLDDRGLPLRLKVHLVYPPQNDAERVETDISTSFSFDATAAATAIGRTSATGPVAAVPGKAGHAIASLINTARQSPGTVVQYPLLAGLSALCCIMLILARRSPRTYRTVVVLVIASMVLVPLLQAQQVEAFFERQAEKTAQQEQQGKTDEATADVKAQLTPPWDPHQDPLQAIGDSAAVPAGITKITQLAGVASAGGSVDTDGDGLTDDVECFSLRGITSLSETTDCDSDGDGTPDPFDLDNDGDGVVDQADAAPTASLGRDGQAFDPAAPEPFDRDHPFSLKLEGLEVDTPTLVDIQLRPENAAHLTYAMNVLDWPAEDIDGQIQHGKRTTFASHDTAEQVKADPRLANGDMRLIPMLEVELPGDHVPLALTRPEVDITLTGAISGSVHLSQNEAITTTTDLLFDFEEPVQYEVRSHSGGCPATGPLVPGGYQQVQDSNTWTLSEQPATQLADGNHVLSIQGGGQVACEPIPNIINGAYPDRMVDASKLQPYGISVREKDENGTLLMYASLGVVRDPTGQGNAAFGGRLLYWPTDAGGVSMQAQQVRVVWLLQMLTDQCDMRGFVPSDAAKEPADDYQVQYEKERRAHCLANRTPDEQRIVHTYPEAWYLTGLAARKDLGLDVAIIWEDPQTDQTPQAEDALWHAARGLLVAFVGGPDNDGNGKLDLGVAARNGADGTIQDRLDNNGTVPNGDPKRWSIPKEALQVETLERAHQDYIGQIGSEEVRRILEENFTGAFRARTPTLLTAREETAVSVDLGTAKSITCDTAGCQEGRATVTLSFAGKSSDTLAALSWAPYRYNPDTGPDGQVIGWETYPLREYWDDMEVKLTDAFSNLPADVNPYHDNESAVIGEMVVASSLYLALNQGITSYVEHGSLNAGAQATGITLDCQMTDSCADEYDT